ncbi:cell division protein ZapC [Aliivibrio wodanis]|uniref:Cell division protein ZapC n=1 Tax=Aliivibrio wodanis TaxID=80852 RepID=A0A090IL45_9GAMM|nr:putative uncharacterized protein [Aliivibrio wodanis]VVV04163.1 Cell division protein ZapC [Aliivibrio wodanis]
MLKPSDTWSWYYDNKARSLMLELSMDMVFCVNLPSKVLIDEAFNKSKFSVDDAASYEMFVEYISFLPLSEPRKVELALNCVAAKRFHKPMLPKSWFFESQGDGYCPAEGEVVSLKNDLGEGHFIIVENYECASMCMLVDMDAFALNPVKYMSFCEPVKVMHDRMAKLQVVNSSYYALVG